jgi:hypothetical protein
VNSIAQSDYSRFDSERDPRDNMRYGRLVVSYLQQVKAKAKPEDLLWCSSAADMLISGQWIGSTSIPSLLDEDAEKHESTKERAKALEEFYQATVDQPRIALHVLPAVFAMAVRDKADAAPLIKQARATLTAVAANRDGGMSYSNNESWEEIYNGSSSSRRIWTPQVPEMLLYDAHQRKAEKEFHDEIVPLIRLAYGVDAGTEFDQRARLWFCPEGEFLEAAKAVKARAVRSGRSDSNPSGIIRVWSERGLQVSLAELLADYVSELWGHRNDHHHFHFWFVGDFGARIPDFQKYHHCIVSDSFGYHWRPDHAVVDWRNLVLCSHHRDDCVGGD